MNRFSDFSTEQLIGEKISIDKILNKEIKVLAFRLKNSKIEKGSTYAQIQIELHGELRVIFTNSTVLKEQLQRYKEHLPFCTTIIKIINIFHSVKEDNHGRIPKIFKN